MDAILIYYFLTRVLYKKSIISRKRNLLFSILIVINFFISKVFGNAQFVSYVLIVLASSTFFSYLLNEKIVKVITHVIFGTIVLAITEIIAVNILMLCFSIQPSVILQPTIYRVLAAILSKGMFYLIIKYLIRNLKIPVYFKVGNLKIITIIGISNVLIVFMLIGLYRYMEVLSIKHYIYLIMLGIGVIFFNILIYRTTNKSIYQHQQEIVWKFKEEEFHKKDFYIKSMEDILETIKSQRHDLNNYLSTLYGLVYLEKFQEAKAYIGKIHNEMNNLNVIIDTNHPIITALVSIKKNKSFDNDIDMNLDIELPKKIELDFVDLSIVIGNLLDNAIEACLLIDKDKKRIIDFKMYIEEDVLKIEVKNTKLKSKKIEIKNITGRFTTKRDHENHGYGLGNIEFVVKEHNGNMEILNLEDEFIVNIDLPIEGDKKGHKQSIA